MGTTNPAAPLTLPLTLSLTLAPPLQLQSLTRGLRAEDEPAGHVTSRRAHDEADADAVAVGNRDGGSEGSAGPFAGAFTCCWQDQEAEGGGGGVGLLGCSRLGTGHAGGG